MRSVIIDGVKYVPQTRFKTCADVQSLGTALRAARREFAQSLSDAAKDIGITKSYLWQLEKDKACPSLLIARKIAHTYGISIVSMADLIPDGEETNG